MGTPHQPRPLVRGTSKARRATGGHVIVATFGPNGPQSCSSLPVVRYDPASLRAQFGDAFQLVEHLNEEHRTPSGAVQHFFYCHCVMQ